MDYEDIVRKLVLRRVLLGLNQWQLAILMHTTQSYVSHLENRYKHAPWHTLSAWAQALGYQTSVALTPIEGYQVPYELLPENRPKNFSGDIKQNQAG